MLKLTTTRKTRFKAALMLAGMTQGDWAAKEGLSRGYLNMVLNGKMHSRSLSERIDSFVAEVERKAVAA